MVIKTVEFSFRPPIGRTRPRRVISPVIATSLRTLRLVMAESIAVAMVIPAEGNEPDVAEIAQEIKKGLEIVFVENMEQVLKAALVSE